MTNIILMSGSGLRFSAEGYILPKPLIPVSGQPMILRVIDALPPAEKWIFLVRKEHVDNYALNKVILSRLPNAIIVPEEKPVGQATSCMLALPHLNPEEDIFIAACDNSFLYNREKFSELAGRPDVNAIVWTFTKNDLLTAKPEAWGWVKLDDDGLTIKDMSVKAPVSDNPFNDHAVTATFYFKKAGEFKTACDLMIKENYRINNEFYVDSLPIFYKKLGLKSVIFDVDLYVSWGKPADFHQYEEKEYRYLYQNFGTNGKSEDKLWTQFFQKINLKRGNG